LHLLVYRAYDRDELEACCVMAGLNGQGFSQALALLRPYLAHSHADVEDSKEPGPISFHHKSVADWLRDDGKNHDRVPLASNAAGAKLEACARLCAIHVQHCESKSGHCGLHAPLKTALGDVSRPPRGVLVPGNWNTCERLSSDDEDDVEEFDLFSAWTLAARVLDDCPESELRQNLKSDLLASVISDCDLRLDPLMFAAATSQAQMLYFASFPATGVDCRAWGWTPLHVKASNLDCELSTVLLNAGADVNARDWNGDTPLHLAAYAVGTPKELMFRLLFEHRPKPRSGLKALDVHARNCRGQTAVFCLLLQDRPSLDDLKLLHSKGVSITEPALDGRTPLHLAASSGNVQMVTGLLDLHQRACESAQSIEAKGETKQTSSVLEFAAFVAAKTAEGETAFELAVNRQLREQEEKEPSANALACYEEICKLLSEKMQNHYSPELEVR
jgi:hypothetical protein